MDTADRDLVQAARGGDGAAFATLAERHAPRVRRFLATMTGDDHTAADLAQDALRQALERLPQLAEPDRFAHWLLAIAANRCRNHLRAEVQRRHAGSDALPEVADTGRRSALSSLVRREDAARLALAIDRLPILLREAFVLFHVEELAYADIAALLVASVGTLQVRVHRARALLRQQLGAEAETWWRR